MGGSAQKQGSTPADDFVILSRGRAAEALTWTKGMMTKLGLVLNEAKTSLRDARREHFTFLGYSFGPRHPTTRVRVCTCT
jgi:RNA-directed DNA polymerase